MLPPYVDTPVTFSLLNTDPVEVLMPGIVALLLAVTVTTPADAADTDRFVPKLIVPAVPTVLLSSFMTTPEPDAVIPVSPEPSPINPVAVTTPAELTLVAVTCAAVKFATVMFGVPVNPSATVAIPAVFA